MAMYSGMPFLTAYSGSKAALAIITKNVANGVSGHRIRVNALNIGWTDTPGEDTIQKKFHEGGEDWLEKAEAKVKFHTMRMMFGGQIDDYDFHYFGWNFEFLNDYLMSSNFSKVERVNSFGLFEDTSNYKPYGFPISLNVIAYK